MRSALHAASRILIAISSLSALQSRSGRKWGVVLMGLLLAGAAFALLVRGGALLKPFQPLDPPKPLVFTRTLQKQAIADRLIYPARILPKVNAAVLADADGVVISIEAPLGTPIKRGQTLLTIRNQDPGFRYAPYQVRSPVDGVVGQVDVSVGSRVSRGEKLLMVTDPDRVRVTIEVPAHDLKKLRIGMRGELRLTGQEAEIALSVKGVSPLVDPATGTAHAELQVESVPDSVTLAPGLIGRTFFRTNERQGFLVPDSAVELVGKRPYLRLVENGVVVRRTVRLGRRQGGSVEILSGVNAGEVVIERAAGHVAEGEAVEAENLDNDSAGEA